MDSLEQLKVIRDSGQLHSNWYRTQYPDVAQAGLHPAEHYLKYGAQMGRRPRNGFDTHFYVETYPDVAQSGLNPLVHYILHGQGEGRKTKAPEAVREGPDRIGVLRHKLLSLGFSHRPQSELRNLVSRGATAEIRARAAHELAMWNMRAQTRKGYEAALEHVAEAKGHAEALSQRTQLVTLELLCHHRLGQPEAAQALFHAAGAEGLVTPDVLLAWSNFQDEPERRLQYVNFALRRHDLPELALQPDDGRPLYDRLSLAAPLAEVSEGPKVTVLIAAYNAADTIATALRSLQEQSWTNLEVLVLDDCSPDDTCAVVERFAAADPRIRLVRMPVNGGAYVARNEGLDLATGTYATLHDADDWAHPLRIETQVRFMEENPEVMGCTTQQARATPDLGFTRWTGLGYFITPNISSFMFRRAPMRDALGYWDTARFSADRELIRRMKLKFGKESVVELKNGPLCFQRDSDSSIVADDALGVNGFLFGARKEYLDAQAHYHERGADLRYPKDPAQRRFPVPAIMRADRHRLAQPRHFPVIIASDFRMDGGSIESCMQEIRAARAAGHRVGVFEMYRYDLGDRARPCMLPQIRDEVDGEAVQVLTYGEQVSCDLLVLRYPPILQHRQRYLPTVEAGAIKVIVNQPPVSDYSERGIRRYDLERCAKNIRHYFGKDAVWHPNGPMVRDALERHHADDLAHITLSPQNWDNIIHLPDWQRPLEARRREGKLRIGRHSRDSYVKWPDTRDDILAAYPEAEDVEVHVLGGAETPAAVIGHRPANWVVHGFNAMAPGEFLSGIDVFVFFAHPDWVESFPRTVLEAMAVGVPVILPESHRALFGDNALYATPQGALEVARKLHADPAAYDAQVKKAWGYLEQYYSYAMHARRLEAAGVDVRHES